MAQYGMDISNNNSHVDMVAARAQGFTYVIGKCSQNRPGDEGGWADWTWLDVVARTRAAGMLPGAYHWPLSGNGAAQAEFFVECLRKAGGPRGILCGLDIEENSWDQRRNVDPQTVDDFAARWDELTNKQPLLFYGAPWYHDGFMHAGARWPNRPLWVAQYTGVGAASIGQSVQSVTPGYFNRFGGWTSYVMRQFTDNVVVRAQNGSQMQVDANVTYLSAPQLYALTQPPGKPTPQGEFVMDAAATAEFDQLKQKVDGLITIIQGGIPPAKNPFGLVGTRDLLQRLEAIEAKLGIK